MKKLVNVVLGICALLMLFICYRSISDQQNFEAEALKSDIPVVVDFWASWCGPCKMLAPIIADIASEYAGKVKVGKVNVDEEPDLARQYGIMSIPSLKFFKGGEVVNQVVGAVPKAAITAMFE